MQAKSGESSTHVHCRPTPVMSIFIYLFMPITCVNLNKMGGILVFWESRQNHVVDCEEMKLCKFLGLNMKLKNDESKFLPIMTVKWEESFLNVTNVKYDRHGRSRQNQGL